MLQIATRDPETNTRSFGAREFATGVRGSYSTVAMSTPHDALFKGVLGQPEHARGTLRAVVPAVLGEALDWSTLTLCPGSFVDVALAQQHTDLLYSATWRDGGEALYHGVSPWSEPRSFDALLDVPLGLRPAVEPYLVRFTYLLLDLSEISTMKTLFTSG